MQGKLLITAALARLAFILYGEWQDRTSSLKYTDVDYAVFTDAARFVYQGESPYQRATYRYTPLLAMLLVPSIPSWSFPQFGKLVFVICDLISGWLILQLLQDGGGKEDANKKSRRMALSSFIWLLNPFIITISTRGSSESLLIVLVLSSIYLLRIKRIVLGSIVFGIAVHLKIYPIIYGVPLLLMIDSNAHLRQQQQYNLLSRNRLVFFLVSACTFLGLGIAMYEMYGQEFLNETYLYHIIRKDHRHNYSIFFYYIYLSFDQASSNLVKLLAFIPQFGLVGLMGVLLPRINIFLCLFCQTFVFVIFNKVCTAQYFVWYLCFLPMVLSKSELLGKSWRLGVGLLLLWLGCQAVWLFFAYQLEHEGESTFSSLFVASAMFLVGQSFLLTTILKCHR